MESNRQAGNETSGSDLVITYKVLEFVSTAGKFYFILLISENIRDTAIEIKTPTLRTDGGKRVLQCIALSKRPDVVPNMNDTYIIHVDGKVSLTEFFLSKRDVFDRSYPVTI